MAAYLVTGGGGFIGSHLCHKLIQLGHTVYVLDNLSTGKFENLPDGVIFTEGDVRDLDLLIKLLRPLDGCFHLAAIASVPLCNDFWVEAHHVNLSGTINVFEAAKKAKPNGLPLRVVYASSAAVYGDLTSFPLTETMSSPISVYGLNKLCCEYYAHMANSAYQIPSVGLRLFNIYGPRQNPNSSYTGVITIFLNQLTANEPFIIYGDGKQSRDFIYVADTIKFFLAAMQVPMCHSAVFNVCSGHSVSIKMVGDQLAQLVDVNPRYVYEPARVGDIYYSLGDPSHASEILHVNTTTKLIDGLRSLIDYQKQGLNV